MAGVGRLQVLDHSGDTLLLWGPDAQAELEGMPESDREHAQVLTEAEVAERFAELVQVEKRLAVDAVASEVVREFKPDTMANVVVLPQLAGG